jgi:hypothetical protein
VPVEPEPEPERRYEPEPSQPQMSPTSEPQTRNLLKAALPPRQASDDEEDEEDDWGDGRLCIETMLYFYHCSILLCELWFCLYCYYSCKLYANVLLYIYTCKCPLTYMYMYLAPACK